MPVPPSVEVTVTELVFSPAEVPLTFAVKLQEPPAAMVPPLKLMVPLPAMAVIVPLPQDPVTFAGLATTRPDGRLSVNATPLSATPVFGFVMLKLKVLAPFNGIMVGLKALTIDGGEATVKLAEAVFPVPPLVEVTAPVVFVY